MDRITGDVIRRHFGSDCLKVPFRNPVLDGPLDQVRPLAEDSRLVARRPSQLVKNEPWPDRQRAIGRHHVI